MAGAERLCLELCQALAERGWRVAVIAVGGEGPVSDLAATAGIPWLCIPEGTSLMNRLRLLLRVVRCFEPDLLHTHFLGDDSYTRIVAARTRIPLVATLHNVYASESPRRKIQKIAARIDVSHVVCISHGVAEFAHDSYHLPQERLRVVHNGVDFAAFGLDSRPAPTSRKTIGCVGRLTDQKGQDYLLEAIALLPDPTKYRVLLAGTGPLRTRLEALAHKLSVADRVEFLGLVNDMKDFYSQLDVLVMPSRYEGFGLVAVESMACGVPVIGADVPGLKEVLQVSDLNYPWPVGDVEMLARMIQDSTEVPLSREQRMNLRRAAEQRFSLEQMIQGYEHVYAEVLA